MLVSLVFHNHQPVGQLPWAFDDAWEYSYQPFLDVLQCHPNIKIGLHYTGPLLDWLIEHQPDTIEQLQALVARGQVELLAGGYYEPILAVWPEPDRIAQLRRLRDRVQSIFGVRPRGLWLAERVWEPDLTSAIDDAALDYTFVDSTVFQSAGIAEAASRGYFALPGSSLGVFPIDQRLRHIIPWHPPQESIDYLHSIETLKQPNAIAVFADDGEKFGAWPGTYEHVFTNGWLDDFFTTLGQSSDWLTTVTPGQYRADNAPLATAALPAGSYSEMMEWSGGNWRNFLERYGESRDMHDAVLRLSRETREAALPVAYEHVLRAQSNDAYWHGVFGGLYLSHLRQAIYRETAAARLELDGTAPMLAIERLENGDVFARNQYQEIGFRPRGGHLFAYTSKAARHNTLATLRRYAESYHEASEPESDESVASESEAPPAGEPTPVDWYPRGALLDHFFRADTTLETFASARYPEQGDFVTEPWQCEARQTPGSVVLEARREGGVWVGSEFVPIALSKTISLTPDSDRLDIDYRCTNLSDRARELWWAMEWNVSLTGSDLPERHYHAVDRKEKLSLQAPAGFEAVTNPIVADRWLKLWIEWEFAEPIGMWHVPLNTLSQKEGGELETSYQQSAFVFHRGLQIPAGATLQWHVGVVLTAGRGLAG